MSKRHTLCTFALAMFMTVFAASTLLVMSSAVDARAADPDTVTVSGVSVEWDGNGGAQDLVTLTLEGAAFTSNTNSNAHWDYFMPNIFVNGQSITNKVAWAIEGRYANTKHFCFYLAQDTLKQDGTDIIEIGQQCKIPLNDGADYYVVSETASFIAPVNATNTGTETFIKGSGVSVSGVSVEWDGNGGAQDLIFLTLEGAAFASNLDSTVHMHEIESHIFVNEQAITNKVMWAIEGINSNPKQFRFNLDLNMLKQDGTDVIEVRKGCHIPVNNGASYYMVTETVRFAAPANAANTGTETFAKQFIWQVDTKYDVNADMLKAQSAGTIGEHSTKGIAIGSGHESWGLTGGDAYTQGLAVGNYGVFEFATPVSVDCGSIQVEYMYNAKALMYVYPIGTTALTYENAVQSFRTPGSGIQTVALSASALKDGESIKGFIVQLVDGDGAQFFVDSVTLSADSVTPGAVEKPDVPAEPKKAADVTVSAVQLNWTSASSARLYIHLNGATYTTPNITIAKEMYDYFLPHISVNGHKLSEYTNVVSVVYKRHYNNGNSIALNIPDISVCALQNDGNAVVEIEQGCRFPIEGENAIDYYEVSETVSYRSVSGGNYAQGDGVRETLIRAKDWQVGTKYDIDAEMFKASGAGTIGEHTTQGITLGNGHADWGLTGDGFAYTQGLSVGNYGVFEFATPVSIECGSIQIEYMYNAKALMYIYPIGTTALTYENAVQSFRTPGSGIQTVTLSASVLKNAGAVKGFILQLVDGGGAQFFLDSVTLSADSVAPGEVEEVVTFEWKIGQKYDIDSTLLKAQSAGSKGEYTTKGVSFGSGNAGWGLTGDGYANTQSLTKGEYFVVEFETPLTLTDVKSFEFEIMHNATAGFYVYPFAATELGYDHAVQSFRTTAGRKVVTLSAPELFAGGGTCNGFVIQLATDTGAQFFIDSITLSAAAAEAEKEDFTPPPFTVSTVAIQSVAYTYRYDGGAYDFFMITFDKDIFNKDKSDALNNERVGVEDFAENLLINGQSIASSGLANDGAYALRDMFTRHDRLGIFVKSGIAGSMNNDAFDKVTFKEGFKIRGSSGDNTYYTTESAVTFYTNKALDEGMQTSLSKEKDPQVDQSLTPLAVSWSVSGAKATLGITFDKTVRTEEENLSDSVLAHVYVNDEKLSDKGAVTVAFSGVTMQLSFATTLAADADVKIKVEQGLHVQTNPQEPLTRKTVGETKVFARKFAGDTYFYTEGGELLVYWISSPVALQAKSGEIAYVTFDMRLSVQNAIDKSFNASVLRYILIDGTPIFETENASASLSAFTLTVKVPASVIANGTVITVQKGFAVPAGGAVQKEQRFTYDGAFKEFVGDTDRSSIESLLTPTGISSILTATDGVASGTNQLFISFTTPCSIKYLPFAQAHASTVFAGYGTVGVTVPARYVYDLNRYGIRESLWDYLMIDGKTLREWAIEDGGADALRDIDIYYQGTNFDTYYMQIVIARTSSAVMDWSEKHTVTFKAGFITPMFGVFEQDATYAWDPQTRVWAPEVADNATVDPDDTLKDKDGEQPKPYKTKVKTGCGSALVGKQTAIPVAVFVVAMAGMAALLFVRKRRA